MDREVQITKTVRELDAIEKFLKNGGISNPPDTPSGKLIKKAMNELIACSSKKLPDIHKAILAEFCVSSILIARSAMTTIIQCRRPIASTRPINNLRMQALRQATQMFFAGMKNAMDALKQLNVEVDSEKAPQLDAFLNTIRKDYAKMATSGENVKDIDTEIIDDSTSDTDSNISDSKD